ncbi:MAG TPA: hypothetical protein VGM98_01900 [Schlesneria sp.]|jgi:hypothetical protein
MKSFRLYVHPNPVSPDADVTPPSSRRKRPVDATGVFWALVLTVYGLFNIGIAGPIAGGLSGWPMLIGAMLCIKWQFTKWFQDWGHNQTHQQQLRKSAEAEPR